MNRFQRIHSLKRLLAVSAASAKNAHVSDTVDDSSQNDPASANLPMFNTKHQLVELEARLLFDAAIGVTGFDVGADAFDDLGADSNNDGSDILDPAVSAILSDALDFTSALHSKTIVFVDAAVSDLSGFLGQDDPHLEFFLLDANEDGIGQIADALAGRTDVESVHIISHGKAGALALGNTMVNRADLSGYSAELAIIGDAIAHGGDILIYGCNVAEGQAGQNFVEALSKMTGADIAASSDWTGDEAQGGDWDLEVSVGEIDVSAIFGTDGDLGYSNLLAAPTNTAPASVTVVEDVSYAFLGAELISVNDADFDNLTVELSVSDGTLTLTDFTGIVLSGNGTDTIIMSGSHVDISLNLATLAYTTDQDFNGTDTLVISSADATSTTISNTAINVSPVNDAPGITVPGAQNVTEDVQTLIAGISISDVDDTGGLLSVDLSVASGSLDLNTSGIVVTFRSAASDTLTISGTKAALNSALSTLTYKANLGFMGPDALTVSVNDNGNTGAGGAQTVNDNVGIEVHANENSDFNISDTDPTGLTFDLLDDLGSSDGLNIINFPPPKLTVASAIGEFRVVNDLEPMRAVVEGREDDLATSLNPDDDEPPIRSGLSLDEEGRDFKANVFAPTGLADDLENYQDPAQQPATAESDTDENANDTSREAPDADGDTDDKASSDAVDLSADKFDRNVDQLLDDLGAPSQSKDE